MKFRVRECTDDSSRITATRKQMEEIARMIPLEGRRKAAGYGAGPGFVSLLEEDEEALVSILE
jgi:hypothetical protein